MVSIQSCLRESSRLENYSDTARLDAEILLCTAIEKDRAYLYTWPEKEISPEQLSRYLNFLTRREQGEPIAYIKSGLDDLAHIVSVAPQFLKENGLLLVEHGYQQQQAVAELFKQHGYSDCFCKLDLAGQPRVSGGLVKPSKI